MTDLEREPITAVIGITPGVNTMQDAVDHINKKMREEPGTNLWRIVTE